MVALSTNARLTSASFSPSPSRTARAVWRMNARSIGTNSCGLATEIFMLHSKPQQSLLYHERKICRLASGDRGSAQLTRCQRVKAMRQLAFGFGSFVVLAILLQTSAADDTKDNKDKD